MFDDEARRQVRIATIRAAERKVMVNIILALLASIVFVLVMTFGAHAETITCNRFGCSDWQRPARSAAHHHVSRRHHVRQRHVARARHERRTVAAVDANGNGIVRSHSGVAVRVAPSARAALQCVVDYVEAHGVHIKAMRGYGYGTVAHSLHPSGRALDINQTDRNITHPVVPRGVSNAAADRCGVISGARWGYADNGHWNLIIHGRHTQEPWPRVVAR
jgi:hypothetical protein